MAGIFFLTLSDANAKWLGASYHPLQILFLRALIALPVVTALALWLGGRRVLRTGHLRLHRRAARSTWCRPVVSTSA